VHAKPEAPRKNHGRKKRIPDDVPTSKNPVKQSHRSETKRPPDVHNPGIISSAAQKTTPPPSCPSPRQFPKGQEVKYSFSARLLRLIFPSMTHGKHLYLVFMAPGGFEVERDWFACLL
jgi:hypothetical protein